MSESTARKTENQSPPASPPIFSAALDLARMGLSIIPCKRTAKKEPLVKWTEFQTRRATDDELRAWGAQFKNANIGIVTGAVSGVVVLDVDDADAAAQVFSAHDPLPETPRVQSSRGVHYYFKHPGVRCKTKAPIFPGCDIRADGGFAVLPPSIHHTGHVYTWIVHPSAVPFAPVPPWLLEMIRDDHEKGNGGPAAEIPRTFSGASTPYGLTALVAEVTAVRSTPEGGRNDRLNRASFSIGQLVAGGEITHVDAEGELLAAALASGLKQREAEITIRSGLTAGMKDPRTAPEPPARPAPGKSGQKSDAITPPTIEAPHPADQAPRDETGPAPEPAPGTLSPDVFIPGPNNRPEYVPPLIKLGGVQILTTGNMTLFTSLPGIGKSALCEAIAAASVDGHGDCLGFEVEPGTRVLYVDGERTERDHWRSFDRCRRRAFMEGGNSDLPANIRFMLFSLLPNVDTRKAQLEIAIQQHRPGVLLLDGIGDLCRDANDAAEVSDLSTLLLAMAKRDGFGIVTTIHPNPSGDMNKMRGHLGSELYRRAESSFLLKKYPDGSRVLDMNFSFGKNRSAADDVRTAFRWDDAATMFMSCDPPDRSAERAARKLEAIVDKLPDLPMSYGDLTRAIQGAAGCSEPTAKRRISELSKAGILFLNSSMLYERANGNEVPF